MTPLRGALAALGITLALAAVWWGLWSFDPFGRRAAAKQEAQTARQQVEVANASAGVVERVIRSEIILQQQAMEAQNVVRQAEGADAPLSPAVAASVRDGIGRLREAANPGDADRSAQPSGEVRQGQDR